MRDFEAGGILIVGFRFKILCVGFVKFGNSRDFKARDFRAQNFNCRFRLETLCAGLLEFVATAYF